MSFSRRRFLRRLLPLSATPRTARSSTVGPVPSEPSARRRIGEPAPPGAAADALPLPELRQSVLDSAELESLFRDIAACTEVLEVIPRYAHHQLVEQQPITLDEARVLLARHRVRAVQVRYRYADAEWWDTLLRHNHGVRVVRIRHELDGSHSTPA